MHFYQHCLSALLFEALNPVSRESASRDLPADRVSAQCRKRMDGRPSCDLESQECDSNDFLYNASPTVEECFAAVLIGPKASGGG
jgi:hypothetical protein